MKTKLWKLDKALVVNQDNNKDAFEKVSLENISKKDLEALKEAAEFLRNGELVAFPTETVYGLGADGLNEKAAKKIYEAKGRPADNPLILHIAKKEDILPLTNNLSENAKVLIEKFWPGPLTIVANKSSKIPQTVSAGLDTVAVRMPETIIARKLIELANTPIAAPSANKSGRPSPTNAKDVLEDMNGIIAGVIDGGASRIGVESTIVDTTTVVPTILRPGGITKKMLEDVLGVVEIDPGLAENTDLKPKAPGMKYRHYAPKAKMVLFEGLNAVYNLQKELLACLEEKGNISIGLLVSDEAKRKIEISFEEDSSLYENVKIYSWGENKSALAEKLYTYLRKFDHEKVDLILAIGVEETELGLAIMNRMRKSAGYNIIR